MQQHSKPHNAAVVPAVCLAYLVKMLDVMMVKLKHYMARGSSSVEQEVRAAFL